MVVLTLCSFGPKPRQLQPTSTGPKSARRPQIPAMIFITLLSAGTSACGELAPSLLACLHHFIQVGSWTYFEKRPILQSRMLRHELNSMIHVVCLKHKNAAELFLGFGIGTVGSRDFAVLPIQGQRGFTRLKSFSHRKVPVRAQMVVVLKAFVEHCVSLVLGHARVFCWLIVSQTDVFHMSLLMLVDSSATRALDCSPYSRRAEGKSTAETVFYFTSSSRPERKRRSGSCRARKAPSHRKHGPPEAAPACDTDPHGQSTRENSCRVPRASEGHR